MAVGSGGALVVGDGLLGYGVPAGRGQDWVGDWQEIGAGLEKAGIPVCHFVLHADQGTLVERIESDTVEAAARQRRLDHLSAYREALPWAPARSWGSG